MAETAAAPAPLEPSASTASLDRSTTASPVPTGDTAENRLCFDPEVFEGGDFDVNKFVQRHTSRVALETLQGDLRSYLDSLNSDLVTLINDQYADFVNLSTQLKGVDTTAEAVRVPLTAIRDEVETVKSHVEEIRDAMQDKLAERQRIAQDRKTVKLFLDVHNAVCKLEVLLRSGASDGGVDSAGSASPAAAIETAGSSNHSAGHVLERMASELYQLRLRVDLGREYKFIQNLEARITIIESSLQERLSDLFRNSLASKDSASLAHCIRALAAIDQIQQAHQGFGEMVVRPGITNIVTAEALTGGTAGSTQGLRNVFDAIVEFVDQECSFILDVESVGVCGFQFLPRAVWPEIERAFCGNNKDSKRGGVDIFAPGIAASLHRNYLLSKAFTKQLTDKYCPTDRDIAIFHRQPEYNSFLSKWNLMIYFGLRFHELGSDVEAGFGEKVQFSRTPVTPEAPSPQFRLKIFDTLTHALKQSWHDDVYLPELLHRFVRINFQLLSRAQTWIDSGLTADPEVKSSVAAWAKESTAIHINVRSDISTFVKACKQDIIPLVSARCNESTETAALLPSVLTAFNTSLDRLTQHIPRIDALIVDSVSSKPISTISDALNSLSAMFRINNKRPSGHSSYIAMVIKPVQEFLSEDAQDIPSDVRDALLLSMIKNIAGSLHSEAQAKVEALSKRDVAIRRMKGNKDADASALSDAQKLTLQLQFDIAEFERLVDAIGVKTGDVTALAELRQFVFSSQDAPA